MSESEGQRSESPLLSERGTTTISDTVVSQVAGMAAQEVEGVHMGGSGSRTTSGVLGSITGSESKTSGITVDVGRTEAAIDLKMGIEYNKNILQTVEEVRRRITDRVETMTGLRIKELNATITDITFPEKEERRRLGSRSATTEREDSPMDETSTTSETQTMPESEETSEPATAETPDQAGTGTTDEPEEEAVAEDLHPEAEETTEVPSGDTEASGEAPEADTRTESEPTEEAEARADDETSETTETRTETGTSEQDDAEARMRRRAEERARRRRRSQDS